MTADAQLRFIFMFHGRPDSHRAGVERSQEEVARRLHITQAMVSRLERSALRKLRESPEAKELMRYVSQLRADHHSVEPGIMRRLGSAPEDSSYLTL